MSCKGKKGCFLSNSLRDYAIIPSKSKNIMAESSDTVAELIKKNLKSAGVKKNLDPLINMIMTFACGLSLKLNAAKPEDLAEEIKSFFQLVKNQ